MKDDYMRVHLTEPQAVPNTKGVKTALFLSLFGIIILYLAVRFS